MGAKSDQAYQEDISKRHKQIKVIILQKLKEPSK